MKFPIGPTTIRLLATAIFIIRVVLISKITSANVIFTGQLWLKRTTLLLKMLNLNEYAIIYTLNNI